MRTVAIIQARMGSSRLPGKVLMPLVGKPVLWHIIHRLRKCHSVDTVAVATSTASADDAIEEFALSEGIEVVRGPEDNVLARYALAAEQLHADVIVRVTGDAPLVDPAMIDFLVKTLIENQVDYCLGEPGVPCIHEGFSPFTFRALQKLVDQASDDPVAREHVTGYFKEHPDFVPVAYVPIHPDYQFSRARLSVDVPADLQFLEEVFAHLDVSAGEADVRDVVKLLRAEPDLLKINSHVHQKAAYERSRRVLFRCDGDEELGLGHVVRCIALADELREAHGWGVSFAMARGPAGFDLVRGTGYPVECQGTAADEDSWVEEVIRRVHPDALVLDVRSGLMRHSVEKWRSEGVLVVTLDDASERRLAADLAFYPPVPQVQCLDWTGFTGQLYAGWEWVVLRKGFVYRPSKVPHERPVVLVTMGGSDPAGLTLKAVEALDLLDDDFETVVALGPGFSHHQAVKELMYSARRPFNVRENVADLPGLMAQADLAVAAFGVTAYELAAMAVPAIFLCMTSDHVESASAFVEAGLAVSLGEYDQVTEAVLAETIGQMLDDALRRSRMMEQARQLVIGQGTREIARVVMAKMKEANA